MSLALGSWTPGQVGVLGAALHPVGQVAVEHHIRGADRRSQPGLDIRKVLDRVAVLVENDDERMLIRSRPGRVDLDENPLAHPDGLDERIDDLAHVVATEALGSPCRPHGLGRVMHWRKDTTRLHPASQRAFSNLLQ
jgi:hypothetical protein